MEFIYNEKTRMINLIRSGKDVLIISKPQAFTSRTKSGPATSCLSKQNPLLFLPAYLAPARQR